MDPNIVMHFSKAMVNSGHVKAFRRLAFQESRFGTSQHIAMHAVGAKDDVFSQFTVIGHADIVVQIALGILHDGNSRATNEVFFLRVQVNTVRKNRFGKLQHPGLSKTLHHPFIVLLHTKFLINCILSHMHVNAGVVLLSQFNRPVKQLIADGKGRMQPHVTLTAGTQKRIGFLQAFFPGVFTISVGYFITQQVR